MHLQEKKNLQKNIRKAEYMEKEQAVKKAGEFFEKAKQAAIVLIRMKFFFPVFTGVSAVLIFAGTVRRYGLKAAVRGAAKAEKQLHPEQLRKWKQRVRKRRRRRRIALVKILASKQTKKKPGYKKFIKVLKLYK